MLLAPSSPSPSQTTIDPVNPFLHSLQVNYFPFYFGIGDSHGIPPNCTISTFTNPTFSFDSYLTSVVNDVTEAQFHLPAHIYSILSLPVPPRPASFMVGSSIHTLHNSIQRVQCMVAACTDGEISVGETGIGYKSLYKGMSLLSTLSVLGGQVDYSTKLLNDMYKILGLIKEGSLVGATAKDEFWQGAKVFTLTKLGQNTAMQNSLPAALAFYQGAAEAEPASRRSISLLNHIAACHLAIGDISSFVNVSEEMLEAYHFSLSNIFGEQTPEFNVSIPAKEVFFKDSDGRGGRSTSSSNPKQFCRNVLNNAVLNIYGDDVDSPNLPHAKAIVEQMDSLNGCLHIELGRKKGREASELPSKLHFSLGRKLQKRGFTNEALYHLRIASGPFIKDGALHQVYSRLALPMVFDSLKNQALTLSGFQHELGSFLGKNSIVKNCDAIKTNFDVLPLIRFAEETDIIDYGYEGDSYSLISKLYYQMCPDLYRGDTGGGEEENSGANPNKRIGIVSSTLYNHPTAKTHGGLLKYLASLGGGVSQGTQIVIACYPTFSDTVTKRVMKEVQGVKNLGLTEGKEAEQLRAEKLDVILYLDLPLDARSYALAHQRLAKTQVGLYGHHAYTSGIEDTLDYVLIPGAGGVGEGKGGGGVDGTELATSMTIQYSEQVVVIEGLHIGEMYGGLPEGTFGEYEQSPLYTDAGAFHSRFLLPEDANVYLIPASAPHFHPEFDSAIKAILRADPRAQVVVALRELNSAEKTAAEEDYFSHDLLQHGFPIVWGEKLKMRMKKKIAGGKRGGGLWRRVKFLSEGLAPNDYAAVLKMADVVLDTFPFCNFVNSIEALSVGTPVVTLGSRQRKGGGRLVAIWWEELARAEGEGGGEDECCNAADEEEFVDLAVRLANDKALRSRVVKRIESSRMFDDHEDGYGFYKDVGDFLLSATPL
ncbi:hypothetical protein TrCOL_g10087 [Triparma columacea]|nr:hypothetical protein TrCOL_g10087 [Triparma columacea]